MRFLTSFTLLFSVAFPGITQTEIPNNLDPAALNPTADYALINDLQHIEIDKEKTKITFDFISEDTSGTIEGLDFDINFNPNDPNNASLKGTALVETLDTGNFLRDGHLMWKKFFYEKKYPKIKFESTQVVDFDNDTFKVIGNLTVKETTKEVIITFRLTDKELKGTTTLYTSDYDVNIHDERERNKLNVMFNFPLL